MFGAFVCTAFRTFSRNSSAGLWLQFMASVARMMFSFKPRAWAEYRPFTTVSVMQAGAWTPSIVIVSGRWSRGRYSCWDAKSGVLILGNKMSSVWGVTMWNSLWGLWNA